MEKEQLEITLDNNPEYQSFIYARGFLITDAEEVSEISRYPFFGQWREYKKSVFKFIVHIKLHVAFYETTDQIFFIIGHAYNPFTMEYEEEQILEKLENAFRDRREKFLESFNQLTGIFLLGYLNNAEGRNRNIFIVGDPAGIQTVFYGRIRDRIYISSHTQLIGDICGLQFDPFVERLIHYRFYHLLGKALPGDLSPYKEIKRIIPNHYVNIERTDIMVQRFFPTHEYKTVSTDEQYQAVVFEAKDILARSMILIAKKWKRPAISLTGGCDSKTTLACANGMYDKYRYFSYISSSDEKIDADAAHRICQALNCEHTIYKIPEDDAAIRGIEIVRSILEWNCGNLGKNNANDVRKRACFASMIHDFDVEVKSWVSEIGRAYYSKRFLKKSFPKHPTPRYLTTLYKIFITDRKLVHDTDLIFSEYIKKYMNSCSLFSYPWQEIFFWEFRMSSWNGLVISGEHKFSFDITVPYNNRRLIDLMLSVPFEYRVKDKLHMDIRTLMNPAIDETGIFVTNVKHTKKRALIERAYLELHSVFPF